MQEINVVAFSKNSWSASLISTDTDGSPTAVTTRLFELLLGPAPTAEELEAAKEVEPNLIACSLINSNDFTLIPQQRSHSADPAGVRSWNDSV